MKIYHGDIITVNKNDDVASYLVEDDGKIVFVGNKLPTAYSGCADVLELGEKALIPSFCDTHQHFASYSIFRAGLNVMNSTSNKQIVEELTEFSKTFKGKILIAFGASPYSVEEQRLLSREEMDVACPDKMAAVIKYDGHACIVNSKLLKKLPKKIKELRGYHPDTGEMNQEAFFAVSDFITNSVSIPELIRNMTEAMDYEASQGIGEIHTVSGVGFPMNLDIATEHGFSKCIKNDFQLRVFPQSMDPKVATKKKLPRIGGCFKCALDGCFGSQDAAMNEPYSNDPKNSGVLYYTDEQVIEFCKKANRLGLQIEMHAIGDKAFDQATKALKAALDDFPREDHRHGIIHCCLPTEKGIEICAKYHIQMPMQIAFDNWRQEPMKYCEELLGKERASRLNPIKTLKNRGITISFGSDGPCTTPNPIAWLSKAVNHSNPNESITIQEALRMSTFNGYWTTFDEKERGSLEEGKIADMVILSKNPYQSPKEEIGNIKVVDTILRGKSYKHENVNMFAALVKGIL